MSVVRDPAFWRRFSTAVHMDEEAQAEAEKRPDLKHSYVDTHALPVEPSQETQGPIAGEHHPSGRDTELEPFGPPSPAPPGRPSEDEKQAMRNSQSLNAPAPPYPRSRSTSPVPPYPPSRSHSPQRYSPSPSPSIYIPQPTRLRSQSSSYPLISPVALSSRNMNRKSTATIYSEHSLSFATPPVDSSSSPSQSQYPFPEQPSADEHAYPTPVHPSAHPAVTPRPRKESEKAPQVLYTRRNNSSTFTLGLSGRPRSRGFQFWTSVTADPSNRESWLEEQQRKKSKRTCMCWGFWLAVMALVAGIVVTVLLLKAKGIL